MPNDRTDIPDDLADAIREFVAAGRKYRQFLKENYRDRLHGVIYAEMEDGEMVLYSEGARFNPPIKQAVQIIHAESFGLNR